MKTLKQKQQDALQRLKLQLKLNQKTKKGTKNKKIPLTEKDKRRIKKGIEILESKIKS